MAKTLNAKIIGDGAAVLIEHAPTGEKVAVCLFTPQAVRDAILTLDNAVDIALAGGTDAWLEASREAATVAEQGSA